MTLDDFKKKTKKKTLSTRGCILLVRLNTRGRPHTHDAQTEHERMQIFGKGKHERETQQERHMAHHHTHAHTPRSIVIKHNT